MYVCTLRVRKRKKRPRQEHNSNIFVVCAVILHYMILIFKIRFSKHGGTIEARRGCCSRFLFSGMIREFVFDTFTVLGSVSRFVVDTLHPLATGLEGEEDILKGC